MSDAIHLTARACEWLVEAPTFYGVKYRAKLGAAACGTAGPLALGEYCGVEDVRALYLGHPRALVSVEFGNYKPLALTLPTCFDCRVLMDRALETARRKTGKYRYVDGSGWIRFGWHPPEAGL